MYNIIFYFIKSITFYGLILFLGDETEFGHTTLANLEADKDVLWAHISLSFLLFPVAILVMRRFSVDVRFQEVGIEMRKTLMIERVPKYVCKEIELKRHFNEAYPEIEITKIDIAYDVRKLQLIYNDLKVQYTYSKEQKKLAISRSKVGVL